MFAPPPAAALLIAAAACAVSAAAADGANAEPVADRWAAVRDDTLGVRPGEGPLFEAVLTEVRAADPAALAAEAEAFRQRRRAALNLPAGRDFPAFVDLFQHPAEYRGEPVTLIGQARKIQEYPAGPTAADPDEPRVEVWLYTDDSQTNPAVVVAAAAPGLPRGDDLREPVKVTGRFFKAVRVRGAGRADADRPADPRRRRRAGAGGSPAVGPAVRAGADGGGGGRRPERGPVGVVAASQAAAGRGAVRRGRGPGPAGLHPAARGGGAAV